MTVFSTKIEYKTKPGKKPPPTLDRELRAWQTRTTAQLQQQPPPRSGGKVRWTSPKQKRFVLGAVLKRDANGNIIPYQRTGKMAQGWEVFVDYDALANQRTFLFQLEGFLATISPFNRGKLGGRVSDGLIVSIFNKSTVMKYVEGFQQQGFHKDTGWQFAPEVIGTAVQELDGIFQDTGIL